MLAFSVLVIFCTFWIIYQILNHNVVIMIFCRAAVVIHEDDLGDLVEKLKEMSDEFILEMQEQIQWLYQKYFSSLKAITRTTLDILNDRVFPQNARTYEDWNSRPNPVRTVCLCC